MSVILQKLSRAEFLVAKIYGILSDFYSKLVVYYSRISTDVLRLVVEEKLHDEMLKYEELKNAGWKVCRGPLPLSRSLSSAVGLSDGVLVRPGAADLLLPRLHRLQLEATISEAPSGACARHQRNTNEREAR
jgi:hypothetical protein